ncbi:MAG: hypothetical protein H0U19_14340 [Acidobacteria bacterium]|nr:hypothetical protein [Acidobacteriota bacterium]
MNMKAVAVAVLTSITLAPVALLAVDSKKAMYVGGTIAGMKEKTEGQFDTTDETNLIFRAKKSPEMLVPYASITELEYGQKAGRRVGMAIMVSPLALFSKKRNHFLTITYTDAAGKEQAAVFELGKDIVRTAVKVVETRSGKDVQYQDDDARKSLGGGKGK